ncbi:MAG: hypothetical protein RIK85_11020 [Marinobacter sp.]
MVRANTVVLLSVASSLIAGCASRAPLDIEDLPPTAAGSASEHIIDRDNIGFYTTGDWRVSSSIEGFQGQDYLISDPGTGENVATWNLNIIRTFDIFAKWSSTSRRGSNVKFIVHHLDNNNNLVTETVTVDQRENGGQWFKLGTYRMSTLTGRVTVSNDADGWVVADAVLFRETGVTTDGEEEEVAKQDSDGDGMPDEWEREHGLDPNDPSDADQDADGDGLSNKDELLFLTDPNTPDTDSDGIPDGFEVSYGLDPTTDDATEDSDGDGSTNLQEYQAGTDPNDEASAPPDNSVYLTWDPPTERTDGTPLAEGEIKQYELFYQRISVEEEERVIDNTDQEFTSYGGGRTSTGYGGYIGDNYFLMDPGTGEVTAEWGVYNLTPGTQYELYGHWVSSGLRASNATYGYTYTDSTGKQVTGTATVDQRENSSSWQLLGTFEPADQSVMVSINNDADGWVVADAIRLNTAGAGATTVLLDATSSNSYVVEDLEPGEWQFKIRAINKDGLMSDYSEIATRTIE